MGITIIMIVSLVSASLSISSVVFLDNSFFEAVIVYFAFGFLGIFLSFGLIFAKKGLFY